MPPGKPQNNTTTELSKQRTRAAAERTLLSWISSSFKLVGLGVIVSRVFTALEKASSEGSASLLASEDRALSQQTSFLLSLGLLLLGLIFLALAIREYTVSTRLIQRKKYTAISTRPMRLVSTAGVILLGITTATIVVLQAR